MKYLLTVARVLLGLVFLIFGLNGFFLFIPVPDFHPFMDIMVSTGFIYFEKAIEVVAGLLLLANRYLLLALLLLGPIVVNILLYHLLIDPRNWPIAVVNLLLYLPLVLHHRQHFEVFFRARV